ncbi:MAG: tetratricopeptide repeat protein [Planctomycetes bacterium]|nr:tetratricopeptide repeat protein [Planctomycetota bacterium]
MRAPSPRTLLIVAALLGPGAVVTWAGEETGEGLAKGPARPPQPAAGDRALDFPAVEAWLRGRGWAPVASVRADVISGRVALARGEAPMAAAWFGRAALADPRHPGIRLLLAYSLHLAGEQAGAREIMLDAFLAFPFWDAAPVDLSSLAPSGDIAERRRAEVEAAAAAKGATERDRLFPAVLAFFTGQRRLAKVALDAAVAGGVPRGPITRYLDLVLREPTAPRTAGTTVGAGAATAATSETGKAPQPGQAAPWRDRAAVDARAGRYGEAARILVAAAAADSRDAEPPAALAALFLALGRDADAGAMLVAAAEIDPSQAAEAALRWGAELPALSAPDGPAGRVEALRARAVQAKSGPAAGDPASSRYERALEAVVRASAGDDRGALADLQAIGQPNEMESAFLARLRRPGPAAGGAASDQGDARSPSGAAAPESGSTRPAPESRASSPPAQTPAPAAAKPSGSSPPAASPEAGSGASTGGERPEAPPTSEEEAVSRLLAKAGVTLTEGDADAAAALYVEAARRAPSSLDARLGAARAAFAARRFAEAGAHLRRAMDASPQALPDGSWRAMPGGGERYDGSRAALEAFVDQFPRDGDARLLLAYLALIEGRAEQARLTLRIQLVFHGDDAHARRLLEAARRSHD